MKLELNQKVYVCRSIGWSGMEYFPAVVVKITPSGMSDVMIGSATTHTRFDKHGRERSSWSTAWSIDDQMPYAERVEWVRKENIRLNAVDAYNRLISEAKRLERYNTSVGTLKEIIRRMKSELANIEEGL